MSKEQLAGLVESLRSVLCDPEGEVVIAGSDGDRKVVADALANADAILASLPEHWGTISGSEQGDSYGRQNRCGCGGNQGGTSARPDPEGQPAGGRVSGILGGLAGGDRSGVQSGRNTNPLVATLPEPGVVSDEAVRALACWMAVEDGHKDPHHLIWEGSPPEPWGEVWNRYEDDARAALNAALPCLAPAGPVLRDPPDPIADIKDALADREGWHDLTAKVQRKGDTLLIGGLCVQPPDAPAGEVAPSEAVYAFGAALTCMEGSLTVGSTHDAAPMANLCEAFRVEQGWEPPRDDYTDRLRRLSLTNPASAATAREVVDRVSKMIADHIGHGMGEKCEALAERIVGVFSAPHPAPATAEEVVVFRKALKQIAEFKGTSNNPVRNSVKKSSIARAALAAAAKGVGK